MNDFVWSFVSIFLAFFFLHLDSNDFTWMCVLAAAVLNQKSKIWMNTKWNGTKIILWMKLRMEWKKTYRHLNVLDLSFDALRRVSEWLCVCDALLLPFFCTWIKSFKHVISLDFYSYLRLRFRRYTLYLWMFYLFLIARFDGFGLSFLRSSVAGRQPFPKPMPYDDVCARIWDCCLYSYVRLSLAFVWCASRRSLRFNSDNCRQ